MKIRSTLLAVPAVTTLLAAMAQAQVAPLRVTQVYGGGGGAGATYGRDYVEILNYGPSPIDMSKFNLQYAATTGTSWTPKPLAGTAQPGQYFLVSLSPTLNPVTALDLPTPDFQPSAATAMAAGAGKVALTLNNGTLTGACPTGANIIDLVGYGTGTNCSETAPTGTISITTSATRSNSCADTNNNAGDFAVVAPSPRNSASAGPGCSPLAGSDVTITASASVACPLNVSDSLVYTFTVTNLGGDPATGVVATINLPTGAANFASSVPALVPSGNTLTWNLGTVNVGSPAVLTVTMTAATAGRVVGPSASVAAANDIATYNNSLAALANSVVFSPPQANVPRGILNTRAGMASALDPVNAPGVSITGTLQRPFFSPDRSHWIMVVDTDAGTGTNDEAMLVGTGNTWTVPVREGSTSLPTNSGLLFDFGVYQSVDNAGNYAFDGDDNPVTTAAVSDFFVAKNVGSGIVVVAQEGNSVPSISGATYGTTIGSTTLQNNGTVSFYAIMSGLPAASDTALFTNDGNTVLAQEGVGIPGNQVDATLTPTSFTYKAFDTGASDATGFFKSATGTTWSSACTINSATTEDRLLVDTGSTVVQENIAIPGLTSGTAETASPLNYNYTDPDGDTYSYGNLNGGQDWAIRNGTVLAKTDDPIFTGSPLTWDDTNFVDTYFMAVGNPAGDYVIGGFSSNPDPSIDVVLVLNNTTVIAREGDPVDLNGDGVLNDDAYIRIFRNDYASLGDDMTFYFSVEVQTAADRCLLNAVSTGQAFLKINLGPTGPTCGTSDFDGDGDSGTDADIEAFFACLGGNCCALCFPGGSDFDGDGDSGTDCDITNFFRVLAGSPCGPC